MMLVGTHSVYVENPSWVVLWTMHCSSSQVTKLVYFYTHEKKQRANLDTRGVGMNMGGDLQAYRPVQTYVGPEPPAN